MATKKKMDAAAKEAMEKFFSGSQSDDKPEKVKSPAEGKKTAKKRVFSFRGDDSAVTSWRIYADAAGMKVDELGTAAMTEYINGHPLNQDQQKIYDLKMKQKGE